MDYLTLAKGVMSTFPKALQRDQSVGKDRNYDSDPKDWRSSKEVTLVAGNLLRRRLE